MIFGNWLWPLRRCQLFSTASASLRSWRARSCLRDIPWIVRCGGAPWRRADDVRRAQVLPVLAREVVEGEQRVAILDQALDRLVVFDAPQVSTKASNAAAHPSWSKMQRK